MFPDPFNQPPAIKETKKKYANFTIREIGGPSEILAWRAEQAKKESAYLARTDEREQRRLNAVSELGSLDEPTLTAARDQQSWFDKLEYAKKRQSEFLKPDPAWVPTNLVDRLPDPEPEPKRSWLTWIWDRFKSIWRSANF